MFEGCRGVRAGVTSLLCRGVGFGDHSTPSMLESNSWHPVPTLIVAKNCRTDGCQSFGESECLRGGLGQFEAKYIMSLALANAGRLGKYGA